MSEMVRNTDRELWRETPGDYYAPSLHVTEGGGIGMNVGGFVIVKPIREWHALLDELERVSAKYENACKEGVRIAAFHQERADRLAGEVERLKSRCCAICNDTGELQDAQAWDCGQANSECPYCPDKVKALTASQAKLVGALESIAKNTCCGSCQEAVLVAKQALNEAQGE